MGRPLNAGRPTRSLNAVLVLIALLLLAVGLWVASTLVADPLTSVEGSAKTEGYRHVSSIYGSGPDRLHRPTEVATDANGNIYVADSFKHRIVVFDSKGAFIRTFGSPANVDGALKYPSAIEVDGRGRVYVTSSEPGRVVVFDSRGKLLTAFDVPEPLTLAIKGDRLYVATSSGILIGDLDGKQVGQMLSHGKEPGQIDRPTGMVVGDDGTIYLADSLNYRFQAVDDKGDVKWTLGKGIDPAKAVTDQQRDYGLPAGLAMGSDGVLYGVDAFNGEIIAISDDGTQLGVFGSWGRQDGQFYYPSGITQVAPERFAIADTFNDRVQIVGIPSPRPTTAIAARRAFPWLVPGFLLAALLLLVRRPVAVVADVAGVRRAHGRGLLPDLLANAKTLYVPVGAAEQLAPLVAEDDRLMDALREVEIDDRDADTDPAVEIAIGLRGRFGLRRVALAFPSEEQAEAVAGRGIGVLGERAPEGATATVH